MGGYDIFRTALNPSDSSFASPENLGWPINSTDDDLYFVMAANGRTAYFSSGRKGGQGLQDIYRVEPDLLPPVGALQLLAGVLTDGTKPLVAQITVRDKKKGTELFKTSSTPGSGKYLLSLPAGQHYNLLLLAGSLKKEIDIDLSQSTAFEQRVLNLDLASTAPVLAGVKTPTEAATPSPAATVPSVSPASPVATGAPAAKPSGAVLAKAKVAKIAFVPKTKYQEKTIQYAEKYGNTSAPGLEVRVQFAALKSGKQTSYPELARVGKVETLPAMKDGFTRLSVGGSLKTLIQALEINKKTVKAGHPEAYVICFYNGKRISFENLEKEGVFKAEP